MRNRGGQKDVAHFSSIACKAKQNKTKTCQTRILCSVKVFFRNKQKLGHSQIKED